MAVLAATVFDLVDRIAAADTVPGVWNAFLGAAGKVGLPYGATSFYPPDASMPFQLVAEAMPPGYMRSYVEDDIAEGDVLTARARTSTTSFEWHMDDWDASSLTAAQKRWYAHNLRHGIRGGLIVLDFRRGENMVLVVCGPDGGISRHDRLTLYFAGQEAMLRLRELAVAAPMQSAPLSPRERECLQWAAIGKTDWEIGQILSLSDKTVNVYVERAKSKLGVNTRAQAIARAMRVGLIAAA